MTLDDRVGTAREVSTLRSLSPVSFSPTSITFSSQCKGTLWLKRVGLPIDHRVGQPVNLKVGESTHRRPAPFVPEKDPATPQPSLSPLPYLRSRPLSVRAPRPVPPSLPSDRSRRGAPDPGRKDGDDKGGGTPSRVWSDTRSSNRRSFTHPSLPTVLVVGAEGGWGRRVHEWTPRNTLTRSRSWEAGTGL